MLQQSFERCDQRPICLPSIRPCFAPSTMIQIPRQGGGWAFLSLFITQPIVLIPFAHLSNPGPSIPMKCSLFEAENLTSTNGCTFSRALCHKMITLSPFLEMGSRVAERGRSTPLKASANLRKHKAGFFQGAFFHSTLLGHSTGGLWLCLQSWELYPGVWQKGVMSWAPKPPAACN